MSAPFCGTCERSTQDCGCRRSSFVDLIRERLNGSADRLGENWLTREWLHSVLLTAADLYDRGAAGGQIFRYLREALKTIEQTAAAHQRALARELPRLLEGDE